jgi:hypothetical protein
MKYLAATLLSFCFGLSSTASAYSVTVDYNVDGHDNLFYTDWGHWFTLPGDRGLAEPGSQPAGAVPFNFAGFDSLSVSAGGSVTQDLDAAFDPDGQCVSNCGSILFPGTDFRAPGLTAYSLIGIWSRSASEIDPFYTGDDGWRDLDSGLGLLLIGSERDLVVPDFTSAYLFLAVNDGGFADNAGQYNVRMTASVPEPAPLGLLALGLASIVWLRRRA